MNILTILFSCLSSFHAFMLFKSSFSLRLLRVRFFHSFVLIYTSTLFFSSFIPSLHSFPIFHSFTRLFTYKLFPIFQSLSSLPRTSLFIPFFLRPSFYSLFSFSFSSYPPRYFLILLSYLPLFS
jgi:hypothetical protein